MLTVRLRPHFSAMIFLVIPLSLLNACSGKTQDTSDFFGGDDDSRTDDEAPVVTLTAPLDGATITGATSWAAEASDDVGVTSVSLTVDDDGVETDVASPYGGTWDPSGLINGVHSLAAIARDAAGNEGQAVIGVTLEGADGLDPDAIQIINPTDGATICGQVQVQTLVSDDVVSVQFTLNGVDEELDSAAPFAWDWDTTSMPDLTYSLVALASDAEGRQAMDTVVVEVLNDDVSCDNQPSVVWVTPEEGDYVRGTADLSVQATDDVSVSSVSFGVDSGLLVTDSAVPYETSLDSSVFDDGAHTLSATATDSAGQSSTAQITVTVDNTAPVLAIDTPTDASTVQGTVPVTITATDNYGLDSVTLYLDDVLYTTFSAEPYDADLDTTALDYGGHTLTGRALDLAGNEAEQTIRVSVDNPPVVTFTEPTDTTVYGVATVTAEASDDDRVIDLTLSQDGTLVDTASPGGDVTTTIDTCDLAHGTTLEMLASATDSGGNDTDETLTLTVDQPLEVGVDTYSGTLDYQVTLGASVQDDQRITGVVWDLDGTRVGATSTSSGSVDSCFDCGCARYTTTWSTSSASEGTHTLTATVTNSAGESASDSTTVTIGYDHDGDGYDSDFYGGDDCDDSDADTSPATPETCDGTDEDCDGDIDEDYDLDGDGYTDETRCSGVASATDCDDGDATVYPGASDTCDGVDDDCDGRIDNQYAWTSSTVTFGDKTDIGSLEETSGNIYKATQNTEIHAFSAYLYPGSGSTVKLTWSIYESSTSTGTYTLVDSNTTLPGSTSTGWYSSDSFDVTTHGGYYYILTVNSSNITTYPYADKTPSLSGSGGLTPSGYARSSTDRPASISVSSLSTYEIFYQRVDVEYPRSTDVDADLDGDSLRCGDCDDDDDTIGDGFEELCDGVDNDCDDVVDDAADDDSDGVDICSDCDDGDPTSYPDADEVCDGADNDCDGSVDEDATDGDVWYSDGDDDGYGVSSPTKVLCEAEDGWGPYAGDCDDDDAMRSPGVTESCNGIDDDCDGSSDEGFDADGDGYGSGASCSPADCDDTSTSIHPEATERCNSKDDDCDGAVDDDATDGTTYYADADSDGYGDPLSPEVLCSVTTGYVRDSSDCDDGSAAISPVGTELCDEVDDDCDGLVDEGFDGDGDGVASCSDCDDSDADISPLTDEVCGNGVDDDCDGFATWCRFDGTNDLGSTGYKLRGELASDYTGYAVASNGDMDGDGQDDILVGGYANDLGGTSAGVIYVVSGSDVASMSLGDAPAITLMGSKGDYFGYAVSFVGDQDGDGYDDALLGGIYTDDLDTNAGGAYLVEGPITADMPMTSADARFKGENFADTAGSSIAAAGDVDDDGEPDFLIGAMYADPTYGKESGAVYLLLGPRKSSMSLAGADLKVTGTSTSDHLGSNVSGGGDTNADGYDDIVMGDEDRPSTTRGEVYIILGPATGTGTSKTMADTTLTAAITWGYLGTSTAIADVDGDGYDDVAAGSQNLYTAYLMLGPVTTSASVSTADATITGESSGDLAASMSLSDLDADGYADMVVGAPNESDGGSAAGNAYVFYGPLSGSISYASADATFNGEDSTDHLGSAVDARGDIDGSDGPDLLLGAYYEDNGSTATGSAYVVFP